VLTLAIRLALRWHQPPNAEELRKQLLEVPEVSLDSVANTSRNLLLAARLQHARGLAFAGPALLGAQRLDLAMLPLRMGTDCYAGREPAEALQTLSNKLRANLNTCASTAGAGMRTDAAALRKLLLVDQAEEWLKPEALPTLMQMLQVEDAPLRRLLVELLGRIEGGQASAALALRASADLAPEVRELAVRELAKRRASEVAPVLADLLRYPWPPAAEHAAEALVALDMRAALPQLYRMLNEPDPVLPVVGASGSMRGPVLREVVRVNHLSNCLLCHPPSFAQADLVRGAIPGTGQPAIYGQGGQDNIFVRADVTYLRQDFSVVQPVTNPDGRVEFHRYDYMVRQRPLTPAAAEALTRQYYATGRPSRQREALYFVLRELTARSRRLAAAD
jgi:hypothetical protein